MAGSWDYGCIGKLPDGRQVTFDRDRIAVVSTTLPLKFSSMGAMTIEMLSAADANGGFQKEMIFKDLHGDDTIKLTELKSTRVSQKSDFIPCGENRVRQLDDERTRKTYEILLPKSTQSIKVDLKCFEASTSACG